MTDLTKQMLEKLNEFFEEEKLLNHAAHVVQFDMETVCPPKGMELAGETQAYLSNKIFKIHRDPNFLVAAGWGSCGTAAPRGHEDPQYHPGTGP